jgi:hypothetical protein
MIMQAIDQDAVILTLLSKGKKLYRQRVKAGQKSLPAFGIIIHQLQAVFEEIARKEGCTDQDISSFNNSQLALQARDAGTSFASSFCEGHDLEF